MFLTHCNHYEFNSSIDLNCRTEQVGALLNIKDYCSFQRGACHICDFSDDNGCCIFGEREPILWDLKNIINNFNENHESIFMEVDNDE